MEFKMAGVEERLTVVEREVEKLKIKQNVWPIAQIDEKLKGDAILSEVFRLANEERRSEQDFPSK
jgi:hypothetical protein